MNDKPNNLYIQANISGTFTLKLFFAPEDIREYTLDRSLLETLKACIVESLETAEKLGIKEQQMH